MYLGLIHVSLRHHILKKFSLTFNTQGSCIVPRSGSTTGHGTFSLNLIPVITSVSHRVSTGEWGPWSVHSSPRVLYWTRITATRGYKIVNFVITALIITARYVNILEKFIFFLNKLTLAGWNLWPDSSGETRDLTSSKVTVVAIVPDHSAQGITNCTAWYPHWVVNLTGVCTSHYIIQQQLE